MPLFLILESGNICRYTRDALFFRLLNQALRTEDMSLVYQFRYLITQLCAQIEVECRKQINDDQWTSLYRGFQLHEEELGRLKANVDGLISTNSFFSTSRDKRVALMFTDPDRVENQLVNVLLEVQVNPARLQSCFFADIQHLSSMLNEEEVLFTLGSIFQIVSVHFDDETRLWLVRLKASDESADRIRDYCQLADHDLREESPITYFGMILTDRLDQPDRAVRYFRGLLSLLDREHPIRIDIYMQLGEAYSRKNDHVRARKCFYKVGAMHRSQAKHVLESSNDDRREDLRRRLEIEEKKTCEASIEKAKLMQQIGDLTETNAKALWFQRAREVYGRLSLPNPSLSACLDELSWVYGSDPKGEQHLEVLYQRLAVDEQYLPAENQQLRDVLEEIKGEGRNLHDDRRFVDFCQRSLDALRGQHNDDHPRLVHMRHCMEKVRAKIDPFDQRQAELIDLYETTAGEDLLRRSECLCELAMHAFRYFLYDQSLLYALQDLQIHRNHHSNLIGVLLHIAICYNQLADYQQAFDYMQQVLAIYESSGNVDTTSIAIIRNDIGKIVVAAAKHHIELPWQLQTDCHRRLIKEKPAETSTEQTPIKSNETQSE